MKKLYLVIPVLLLTFNWNFAQTTITTNYTAGSTTSLTGNAGVVFAIDNSNSHPITITDVGHHTPAGNTADWTLWYNPTEPLTGAPSSVTVNNGWIEVTPTQTATNSGAAGIIPVLSNIEVDIPANTAYRFALVSSNALHYGNASSAPNVFTDEGVSLWVGNNPNSPGYTGAFPNLSTNTPRFFSGFITFTGEIDDCHSPGNLTLDTLMPTTAEFSWTASPHVTGGYDWALMNPGDDPDVDTPIQSGNVTGTSLLISNLTVLTDYVFFIQTDCGADGPSVWRSVEFQTPPTCPGVDNIQVYNMTHQQAEVSWVEMGPATSWNIEYGAPGYTPGTGTSVSTTSNPHTLTGLSMFTEYDLYVQSDCGPGDLSVWFGPFNFHTTIDCTAYALDITSTTDNSVCGGGSVTLEATASGTGTDIFWYDSLTSTTPIGNGTEFQTPGITSTTSFWVAEVVASGVTFPGQAKPAPTATTTTTLTSYGLQFDVTTPFTLVSVDVYPTTGGMMDLELRDDSGTVLSSMSVNVPNGDGVTPVTLTLNMSIPAGNGLRLLKTSAGSPTMIRESSGNVYPYPIGTYGEITGGALNQGNPLTAYYWFYNWTVSTGEVECESPREEVIATVNNQADEEILTLPYTHTASTFDYDNNYSGAPGTDCGTTNSYLDGYDVVYKYTADDDYILNIELSGLTESHTAVFIYESCMDIGNTCYAEGSVNENIGTHSFQVAVEDTKDYYIVVSSASPTDFMNYTLTVTGTTCANYPAPTGPAAQSFINTQTLADLDVTGSDIAWYSDAALTNSIPESTALVNNTTYYATQSFQGCESAALAVTVTEVQCSALEIVSSVDGAVCGEGSAILEAQGATPSIGTEIHWFDAPSGGNLLGKGNTFRTPAINTTTSFWASEVAMTGEVIYGQGVPSPSGTLSTSTNGGIMMTVTDALELVDAEVFSTSAAGGELVIELRDVNNGNATVASTSATMPSGGTAANPIAVTVPLNFQVPPGDYRLVKISGPTFRYESGSFPRPLGSSGTVTGGATTTSTSTLQYIFYNLTIFEGQVICESPREEVIATVNDVADELVTEPLPFAHTANTSAYGNNYEGEPGGDCNDGTPYLDGNETVYQYSPSVGGVYSIELSGLTSNNAAVFVYESCYDIGTNCWAGAVSDGTTGNILIDEVPMYDGFDYFIVVTTATSASTDYTLTVDFANINCSDYTAAPGGDADQFFEAGDTLDDLVVYGGNLTWYSDAAGTNVIPNTTLLVNGTTYYVKQTLNGCDSDLLGITVHEIDCSALAIVSTTDGNIVCKGVAQLEAVGNGGPGTEIYWYDAPVNGNLIGTGSTYTTPVLTSTQSYWVSEVFLEQGSGNNQLPSPCVPVHGSSGCNSGDNIDNFILSEIGGGNVINHIGSGCSPNAFGDFTGDSSLSGMLIAGKDYNVEITHTYQTSEWVRIWIDFDFNGVFDNATEIVFESTSGSSGGITNGSFTIPSNVIGSTTIMRVSTRFAGLPDNACSIGGTFGETHDYKVTIIGSSALCESPLEEVVATVSQDGDILIPSGSLPYIDANNSTANYGNPFSGAPGGCGITDNYLNGHNTVYMYTATSDDLVDIILKDITGYYAGVFVYESCGDIGTNCVEGAVAGPSEDDIEIKEFPFVTGQTYYIVVSSWLTPTIDYTLEIKGFDCATFPAPIGDANQDFAAPAFVSDLEVEGTMSASVLNWYSDAAGTISITDPTTTPLVNGATYYVSQTYGTCESPLLAITVTEIDCSDLEILSTSGGTVTCKGSVTLSATASGMGSEIYWYDAATGGNFVGMGNTFTTPELTSTTSYWATEILIDGSSGGAQTPELIHYKFNDGNTITNSAISPVGNNPANIMGLTVGGVGLDGTALQGTGASSSTNKIETGWNTQVNGSFTIGFWTSNIPASSTLYYIFGDAGATSFRCFTNGVAGANNWMIRGAGLPDLTFPGGATMTPNYMHAVYDASAGTFTAYIDGVQVDQVTVASVPNVTGTGLTVGGYASNSSLNGLMDEFRWYNRALSVAEIQASLGAIGGAVLCESPREEVIATVDQSGDKVVGPLDYTDTDNTANYGGSFSGSPGCDINGNYLDGNAVVYRYSPAVDDIVNIELTNVTNNSTGIFVYQSCGDVGTNCLAGATSVGGVYLIEDFYATGGQDYFIVISSETGSTNYTLNIYGFDCTALAIPTGDATQYFVGTKYVSDLEVEQHPHSTGLTWYEDAAGTIVINDPTTTPLVDNTTYYVSQTVLGCESDVLAITALEFACSDLEIVSTTGGVVCQSGRVTLTAQGGGIGNEIYWYASPTSTQTLGVGSTYETDVLYSTRSYWAEEVYIEGGVGAAGSVGPLNPSSVGPGGGTSAAITTYYIEFDVLQQTQLLSVDIFPTAAVGSSSSIEIRDSAGTTIINVPYTTTVTGGSTAQTIPLNITLNPGTGYRMGQVNPIALFRNTSGATYPYTSPFINIISNNFNLAYHYYFYNWQYGGGTVLCESPRVEVIAEVNTTLPDPPTGNATQNVCGIDSTIGDLVVTGTDIRWYDSNGTQLSANSVVVDGGVYYATQTVNACEGPALEVTVELLEKSNLPTGDRNQTFKQGETLADLDITGTDLKWYADLDKMIPLPDTTPLVDQTTYYVTQTQIDECESDLKPVTVHRFLGVQDETFRNVSVLPIPTSDKLTISNTAPIESVELFNLLGQRVLVKKAGFQNEMELDVSFLSSGTYLLNVIIDGKIGTFKVIKE